MVLTLQTPKVQGKGEHLLNNGLILISLYNNWGHIFAPGHFLMGNQNSMTEKTQWNKVIQ